MPARRCGRFKGRSIPLTGPLYRKALVHFDFWGYPVRVALRALVLSLAVLFAVVPVADAGTASREGDRYMYAVPSDNTSRSR